MEIDDDPDVPMPRTELMAEIQGLRKRVKILENQIILLQDKQVTLHIDHFTCVRCKRDLPVYEKVFTRSMNRTAWTCRRCDVAWTK
jgi:DNA-directed RNA polymerase subunit M/transcription elongation factor TFIIS